MALLSRLHYKWRHDRWIIRANAPLLTVLGWIATVDDLMAIAHALGVSPAVLLVHIPSTCRCPRDRSPRASLRT